MDKPINSPFRYAGGKFYARKIILEHLPKHDTYIELFAGGGSIFFAKHRAKNSWLNDKDPDLINTYLTIRDHPQELIDALKGEEASKERHGWYKNEFKPTNDLERAQRWFYLNRTSYSGIMNMKNCFWGYGDKYSMRPENWPRNILRTAEKLEGVKITNLDFDDVLRSLDPDQRTFLFIDPPYYNADQDKFYTHFFTLADHLRLAGTLQEMKEQVKYLITYDNSQEVWDLYKWAEAIHEKEWNYTIARTDDQKNKTDAKSGRSKGKEIFIINYKEDLKLIRPVPVQLSVFEAVPA
jgi:DNA adenine methylase